MRVPVGPESTSRRPPSSARRSRIPARPIPPAWPPRKRLQDVGVKSPAVVGDGEDDEIVSTEDLNVHRAGLGMAMHVGKRFLENAKQSQLDLLGKALDNFRQMQIDLNAAALRKAFGVPASSRMETEFIEKRRMKKV